MMKGATLGGDFAGLLNGALLEESPAAIEKAWGRVHALLAKPLDRLLVGRRLLRTAARRPGRQRRRSAVRAGNLGADPPAGPPGPGDTPSLKTSGQVSPSAAGRVSPVDDAREVGGAA